MNMTVMSLKTVLTSLRCTNDRLCSLKTYGSLLRYLKRKTASLIIDPRPKHTACASPSSHGNGTEVKGARKDPMYIWNTLLRLQNTPP